MKRAIFILMTLSVSTFAGYTYTITDGMDFGVLSLSGSQSILIDGGGGYRLNLSNYSKADIFKTTPLISEGYGGVWQITTAGYSRTTIEGGDIHELAISTYATAKISGGKFYQIWSSQDATFTKHIEIVCRDGYSYTTVNSTTGYLTGLWGNGDNFNIRLVNVSGTSPTIDNIKFTIIPEPMTLALLGMGGLLMRRK